MKYYRDFRPTTFDSAGAFGLPGDHYVPDVLQTRDSGPLEISNFISFGKALDEANIEYEVHRFGHWGPGWYEIYLVTPTPEALELIEKMEGKLEDYPILDEEDFSSRELEDARETWANCYSVRERAKIIKEYGQGEVSIFAARRDELPMGGHIYERMITA